MLVWQRPEGRGRSAAAAPAENNSSIVGRARGGSNSFLEIAVTGGARAESNVNRIGAGTERPDLEFCGSIDASLTVRGLESTHDGARIATPRREHPLKNAPPSWERG